jgi:hypothetical protein
MSKEELIEKIKSQLPITIYLRKDVCEFLKEEGRTIDPSTPMKVVAIFDAGIRKGILCAVPELNLAVSLTNIFIKEGDPLHDEIEAYQEKRTAFLRERNQSDDINQRKGYRRRKSNR